MSNMQYPKIANINIFRDTCVNSGLYHDNDDDHFKHCLLFMIIIFSYGLPIILILVNCVGGGLSKPGGSLKVILLPSSLGRLFSW